VVVARGAVAAVFECGQIVRNFLVVVRGAYSFAVRGWLVSTSTNVRKVSIRFRFIL
jgi:hypothetical protein